MDDNTSKLDKILANYSVPQYKGDYHALFWAKAGQLPIRQRSGVLWGLSLTGTLLTLLLVVGTFLPKESSFPVEQVELAEHLDELENFDVVYDMEYLELMDSAEVS